MRFLGGDFQTELDFDRFFELIQFRNHLPPVRQTLGVIPDAFAECRVAYNRAREKEARKASRKGLPPRLNVAPPQSRIWEGYER